VAGSGPRPAEPGTVDTADFCGQPLADGRYQVLARLGEGSMGVVYLAYDHRLETEVVIKVPTAATLSDPEFAERFQRETRSLVKLKHPHIVTIHDVGVHQQTPFVVMQYLRGGSLRDRLVDAQDKPRARPLEDLKTWVPALAKALDFIHKQGFLHRDVKPANILFDEHGNAYLSDFGLAKVVTSAASANHRDASLTAAGFLVGTPNYVAPELVMGHDHDGRVDQYSLAMTAYEMVAGCVPVEGPTASATMVNQTSMKIPPVSQYVPGFPAAVSDVLLRGLSKNQKKRFDSCDELSEALIRAMSPAASPPFRSAQRSQRVAQQTAGTGSGGKMSRAISTGRIPCPECGKVLPLKPQFAGKRARCGQCLHLLLIGPNLATLKVIGGPPAPVTEVALAEAPITNRGKKSARDTVRNESGQTRATKMQGSEIDTLLGEEVFGYRLNAKVAVSLALALILILVAATGFMVWTADRAKDLEKDREREAQKFRNAERMKQPGSIPAPSSRE